MYVQYFSVYLQHLCYTVCRVCVRRASRVECVDPCRSIISHFPETPSPVCQLCLYLYHHLPISQFQPDTSLFANLFPLWKRFVWLISHNLASGRFGQFQSDILHLHVGVNSTFFDFIFLLDSYLNRITQFKFCIWMVIFWPHLT